MLMSTIPNTFLVKKFDKIYACQHTVYKKTLKIYVELPVVLKLKLIKKNSKFNNSINITHVPKQ
jgi:hypothetical protein